MLEFFDRNMQRCIMIISRGFIIRSDIIIVTSRGLISAVMKKEKLMKAKDPDK